jgi:hypothetical protein
MFGHRQAIDHGPAYFYTQAQSILQEFDPQLFFRLAQLSISLTQKFFLKSSLHSPISSLS